MQQQEQQQPSNQIALLPPAARAAIVLGTEKAEAQLKELVAKSAVIVAVNDMAGRDEAHRAAMTLKSARVALEKTGKMAREDATAFSRAVIAEEARLQAIITDEEKRVFKLRDDFDSKLAAEKAERQRVEEARVAAIKFKIDSIRGIPAGMANAPSAELAEEKALMEAYQVDDSFAEFKDEANSAILSAIRALNDMHHAAKAREEEAARVAAESEANRLAAAELERQRAEIAAQEAERLRIAAAEVAEQQRVAAETKRQLEAQQAQIAADRKAEEKRIADERATFEAEKAAFAKQQADAAEAARVAALPVETVVTHLDGGDDKHLRVMVDREELPGVEVVEEVAVKNAPLEFSYSGVATDILTIEGIKYAGEMFRQLGGMLPIHSMFELVAREDGVLTVRALQQVAA